MSHQVLVRLKNGECEKRNLPTPSTNGLTISASVGQGGTNVPADVQAVKKALNQVPASAGGPSPHLNDDGVIGPHTIAAIAAFQRYQLGFADSRVDPDGITIATLRA